MKCIFCTMYIKILLLLLILRLEKSNGIIGGFWKSIKNHPYLVAIAYEVRDVCSGSIIMSSWILTAAKCVHHGHVGASQVIGVRIGVTNFDKDEGKLVRKKSIHIHPHFLSDASWDMSVNDIALIQLEKHLEFGPHVHPVGITFQHVRSNTSCLTMGWGCINPNVYLTGKIKDRAFWPKEGENHLRDIEQQTAGTYNGIPLRECHRLLRYRFRHAIHQDFHLCALHYTYANDPFGDPTAPTWDKPGKRRKRQKTDDYFISKNITLDYSAKDVAELMPKNNTGDKMSTIDDNDRNYVSKNWWDVTYPPHYIWWYVVGNRTVHRHRYHMIRINTDGPSYYDYGGPLMCYGQQVGIFTFPVANVLMKKRRTHSNAWPPTARAVYTLLLRYVPWIDTTIEIELNRQENNPPEKPDETWQYNIWDDLNSSQRFSCNKMINVIVISILIFLH